MLKFIINTASLFLAVVSALALGVYLAGEKMKKGSAPDLFVIGLAMAGTVFATFSLVEFFLSPTTNK